MYSVCDTLAGGFPHSEISGSKLICQLPVSFHIQGYHLLWPDFPFRFVNRRAMTRRLLRIRSTLYRDWETDRKSVV